MIIGLVVLILAMMFLVFIIVPNSKMARNIAMKAMTTGYTSLSLSDFAKSEDADLVAYAFEITAAFLILSIAFFPIGYKTWQAFIANKTQYGVVSGSNDDTMIGYIGTLAVLGIFIAILYSAKGRMGGG